VSPASGVCGLAHVLVLTDDLERSREFYERALGLAVGARPPLQFAGYWLYADGGCCLHLAQRSSYRAHARTLGLEVEAHAAGRGPVDHVALTARDYAATTRRLRDCGVSAVANDTPDGGPRQLFLDDPDGLRVEISVPAGGR
jgi:catechol 2,3-dioxygenase-like lactoylglutathione lyase family enzyme